MSNIHLPPSDCSIKIMTHDGVNRLRVVSRRFSQYFRVEFKLVICDFLKVDFDNKAIIPKLKL